MNSRTGVSLSSGGLLRFLMLRLALARRDRWTRHKLLRRQQRSLEALRAHAYAKSPFYRRFHAGLADQPIEKLPVLTKADLMAHWNEVVTDPSLKLDDLRKFVEVQTEDSISLYRNEYVVSTTSGSTGLKGVFAFNRTEWLWSLASHGRAMEWAGTNIGLFRRPRLALISSRKPWSKSLLAGASTDTPILSTLRLDSTEATDSIVRQLNMFMPEILVAYAETAKDLALQQLGGTLRIAPARVFTSSELLTESAREAVRAAWNTEPFDSYAATETSLIAAECEHHHMHLGEDLVIAEAVDKNNHPVPHGAYGEKLLVTVLFSRTIPLIRYEISDSVALAGTSERCACGKPFALVHGIQGRVEDIIYLDGEDGVPVPIKPNVFHDVLEPAPVNGWQVTQESRTGVLVSVTGPGPGFKDRDIAASLARRLAEQGARDPAVRIEVIEKLRQAASGKTPLIRALRG